MIKLRFSPPVYKTYNGGKVTTCLYKCQKVDSSKGIVLKEFSVVGKAKCSAQDVPDEKIGKMIAESKAKYLAFKQCTYDPNLVESIEKLLDEVADVFWFNEKMKRCKKRELEHLKYLTK